MKQADDLKNLCQYRDKLAKLVVENGAYAPIFVRIEQEIATGEQFHTSQAGDDPLALARLIASAHRAMV